MKGPEVLIIGAGLAGSLLAIYLAKRGIAVEVCEARPDMRSSGNVGGRSINLALSSRGIAALREVGLDDDMLAKAVPMYGRMIHDTAGGTQLLRYSGREGEYINSVSRAGLNITLLNEAERYDSVSFNFGDACTGFDLASRECSFRSGQRRRAGTVVATEGAGSAVRRSLEEQVDGFRTNAVLLDHGYKELVIPPADGGGFRLEKNALHIWPRHQFMMIALPNFDGSFTCTLFLAKDPINGGDASFGSLSDEGALREFFDREFPDAVPHMPTLGEDFFSNPIGELGTVKCGPWHSGGDVLLLGDAAHAMVPFYGQGMNCAFEDVRFLDGLLSPGEPWATVFDRFYESRKPNSDAIQDMAEENFFEMRDAVADPVFQRKRKLEMILEQTYPDYFSKYSMVTFRDDLPYTEAKRLGNAQDALLMELCRDVDDPSRIDVEHIVDRVRSLK